MAAKWVLITGATSGIGLVTAKQLLREGHNVIVTGRNLEKLTKLQTELSKFNAFFFELDITNQSHIEDCSKFIEEISKGYGLDILINNAGYPQTGFLLDLTPDQIRKQYETNVFGVITITQIMFPLLQGNKGGIINVGSVQGRLYVPFYSIYSSSKHALKSFSHLLRLEVKRLGVRVTLIEPGTTNTNFRQVSVDGVVGIDLETSQYSGLYRKYQHNNFRPFSSMPAISVSRVSNQISKLVTKKRWKASYTVSIYGRFYLFIQKITPHWLGEWVTRRIFSL